MPTTKKSTKTVSKKAAAKKSAAKKAVSKKAVTKKATSKKKTSAKKTGGKKLRTATNEESFWVTNGMVLNDLLTLAAAFEVMEKDSFSYHVEKGRNDFADWVEVVLEDVACATALRKTKTPKSAKTVVVKHIKLYQV